MMGMMVPGPGDTAVDMTGNKLDRDKFTNMLKEYYRLRGCGRKYGGLPEANTLKALGLEDVAIQLNLK